MGRGTGWTRAGAVATMAGALMLICTAAPPARGAVTVGQLAFEDNPTNCTPATALVTTEVAALTPFTAPSSGVVTSWQTKAGDGSGGTDAKLKVFRATPDPDQFLVVGQSGFQSITASSVNGPFPARISVEAGDYVSIRTGSNGGPCLSQTAIEADVSRVTQGQPDTPTGSTTFFVGTNTQQRANVTATLEPDADRDGFGDETQDLCPSNAQTQATCPASAPTTPASPAAKKKCKKRKKNRPSVVAAKKKRCKKKGRKNS